MGKVRILLVDEHKLVRAGISALLGRDEGLEVVGEAGNGVEALNLIGSLRPEVVLVEPVISGWSAFEFLRISSARFPLVHTIVISVNDSFDCAVEAMRAGAAGYLPKAGASDELGLAIAEVMSGRRYLSPSIGPESERRVLTPRQAEVLRLIAEGCCTKEISFQLEISVKTVETHRALLMARLDIYDVAGLVRFAIKRGWVSLDEGVSVKKTRVKGSFRSGSSSVVRNLGAEV
jgi:DNA-binding NarL/FixJ family response regulator